MNAPTVIEVLYAAGKGLLERGQTSESADVFRAMLVTAPSDERSWLGLGACHEALCQDAIALELYAMGTAASGSVRCQVARSRVLRALGREADAETALDRAEDAAGSASDDDLVALVARERSAQ
jgi:hypothetical protein